MTLVSTLKFTGIGLVSALALSVNSAAQDAAATPETAQETAPAPAVQSETVKAAEAAPAYTVDYSLMNVFLQKFSLRERGRQRLAYSQIEKYGLPFLDSYIDFLTAVEFERLDADGQLAFLLNLHNAAAVRAISTDGNKRDLEKLRGSADQPGKLWDSPVVTWQGQDYSLAALEREILQKYNQPEVLFGLYQGVKGGPALEPLSFEADSVRDVLAVRAETYVNANGIVTMGNTVAEVTPIFTWYKDLVFGDSDQAIIDFLRTKADPQLKASLFRAQSIETIPLNYTTDRLSKAKAKEIRPTALPVMPKENTRLKELDRRRIPN